MITIDLIGRLGNQMFQYALCRTIAEKNGYEFSIPRGVNSHDQNISKFFDIDMGNINPIINNRFSEDHLTQIFNPNIFSILDNTHIWGFYQSEKYFIDNEENVKKWFNLDLCDETKALLDKYPVNEYCYIHFRGTDYKDWDSGNMFLPKKYFDDSVNLILETKPNIKFLVITDDVELASDYFKEYDVISNDMMVDFKLLYSSKYCIVTNSTFSWWASWLSNKEITIAPNNWLNYNRPHLGFYPADIKTNKFEYI